MIDRTKFESLADALASVEKWGELKRAVAREDMIRQGVARTGESYKTVADFIDAHASMGQEAVLSLTDGEPTTLHDALSRYVADLGQAPEASKVGVDGVINHLDALLAYPWPPDQSTQDHMLHLSGDGAYKLWNWLGSDGKGGPFRADRIRFEKEAGSPGVVVRTWPFTSPEAQHKGHCGATPPCDMPGCTRRMHDGPHIPGPAVDAATGQPVDDPHGGQGAVLSLTDGEPITLEDGLRRYTEQLEEGDGRSSDPVEIGPYAMSVVDDLTKLLEYPWPG